MYYFTDDYLNFFKELAANNNKEWFDANRERYENSIKKPFQLFIDDLIESLSKIDAEIQITSKEAIFRINRDIRFSTDKTPYKLNNSAIISKEGKADKNHPGLYIELGPEHMRIYGGVYMPNALEIQKVKESIAQKLDVFNKIINETEFKNSYGTIRGEQQKRIPKEFKEAAQKQPLLLNKQWYYFVEFEPETIFRKDLVKLVTEHYQYSFNLKEFLRKAIGK